jgi:hypothetical protein
VEHNDRVLVFISHAAVDQEIALALKIHLGRAFPGVEVFVSSDPEDLPLGNQWVEKILQALNDATVVLALTTERGLSRKWVWFETGRTWFAGTTCIPCCLGKTRKSGLPAPFQSLMGVNIDEDEDVRRLLSECGKHLGLPMVAVDVPAMIRELIRLDIRAEERQIAIEDPFSSELIQEIDKQLKGFDAGTREGLRLLLKHGELSEKVVEGLVLQSGKYTAKQTMGLMWLETRTGWLIRTQMSPFPNVSRDEDCYKVSDRIRPYLTAWFERNK